MARCGKRQNYLSKCGTWWPTRSGSSRAYLEPSQVAKQVAENASGFFALMHTELTKPIALAVDGQAEPAPTMADDLPVTVIERKPGWRLVDVGELWRYREMLFFLTWRDVHVRYKQTVLGAAWAVLQPLATMIVFSMFFGRIAGIPTDSVPYPLFVFAGLLPWFFFSNGITSASQ